MTDLGEYAAAAHSSDIVELDHLVAAAKEIL